MTEPHHEPSYYEIALTNRQVVVAFVVLLVCLLSAFFSGVWIGRGSAERNAGEQQVAKVAPPPEATEGRNLEELKFFSDESRRRGGRGGKGGEAAGSEPPAASSANAETPPPAPPRPTAAERADRAGSADSAPIPSPPVTRRVPTPASAPTRAAAADDGDVVSSRPLPEESTARDAEGTGRNGTGSAAGASHPAAAQPGAGTVVIQVFASADANEAKKMKDRLSRGGERAFVSPLTVDGRTMYRVRVGPFTSRTSAQKEADRVRKAFKLDTWLTE